MADGTLNITEIHATAPGESVAAVVSVSEVNAEFGGDVVSAVVDGDTVHAAVEESVIHAAVVAAQGPQGPPGTGDGQTSSYVYGETISALKAVVIIDGEAFPADSSNVAHRGLACGVTVTAATVGNLGTVRFLGAMTDPSWNWTGPLLFIGTAGGLVESPPATGFSQPIARAESANTIFVNPLQPIERA